MILRFLFIIPLLTFTLEANEFADRILPFIENFCLDCHDSDTRKGGLDLEGFANMDDVLSDPEVWWDVYEKIESHQMPPPKRKNLPSEEERQTLLRWIEEMAALPDPRLGARDPGKRVLRRLNRLEYNNTVRDLFGLDVDVFLFSERLPIRKGYFDLSAEKLPDHVEVIVREYGSKAPVLLPFAGLPAENRAAHGFNNRGDAMNVSPLLLEKYVALADQIVNEPTLPFRSAYFAGLIGVDPDKLPKPEKLETSVGVVASNPVGSAASYAPKNNVGFGANRLESFRAALAEGQGIGNGGVFDVARALANTTVAGKGGLIRVRFGLGSEKLLTINPNADLWLVPFATANETSGELLIANQKNGAKDYELTFEVKNGGAEEKVVNLGCCVLARRGQSGIVTLTATLTNDSTVTKEVEFDADTSNAFIEFEAPNQIGIKRLRIDGSAFSGDYVLIDDIGFITDGKSGPSKELAMDVESTPKEERGLEPPIGNPRERLENFLSRAFRHPPSGAEVDRFYGLFETLKNHGLDEASAMSKTVGAVLASPSFLFQQEISTVKGGSVRRLTSHELATRLSYFLWASMPDEELRRLTDEDQLVDPEVREAQVRRMLRDPKARELSESFAVQWLRLDQLYTAKPDRELFTGFYRNAQGKDTLHASLLVEALLLFETVMLEDRSIMELIYANYTWLNPRLVSHYGLELVAAPILKAMSAEDAVEVLNQGNRERLKPTKINDNQWFRVPLNNKTRGGVITMAGPLTLTSLPFRTSPIKRGAWLLETIFNRPPSEPKVAFAIEDDTKEEAKNLSVRERFEAHRNKSACYSCHIRLDPPGFALEQFDAVGQWRDHDGKALIDARSDWNGESFDGPAAFKELLVKNPHEFTRGFIEHLLSFALGRELGVHDIPTVLRIQKICQKEGWRFSRVLIEIVNCYPFTHIRTGEVSPED